jgi:hypothetical protein
MIMGPQITKINNVAKIVVMAMIQLGMLAS